MFNANSKIAMIIPNIQSKDCSFVAKTSERHCGSSHSAHLLPGEDPNVDMCATEDDNRNIVQYKNEKTSIMN
jgi:hypothetical protein